MEGGVLVGLCALFLYLLVYKNSIGFGLGSITSFPRTFSYLMHTTSAYGPEGGHPLAASLALTETVPYDQPLGRALQALRNSLLCLALALIWIIPLAGVRYAVSLWTRRAPGAGTGLALLRLPDRMLEQLQRLPALMVYFLVYTGLRLLGWHPPDSLVGKAMVLSVGLANSDGIVPDLSDVLSQRHRELETRDYVKAGLLWGKSRLAVMRRELAMTASDLLGNRLLQLLGGAFVLELLLGYAGIGRACVYALYHPPVGSGGDLARAGALRDSDALYCILLLLLLLSSAILAGRSIVQRVLDPRPRTVVAR
jgi:hypothetical protein